MAGSSKKNKTLALNLLVIVVGMCLLTAASVPLYRLFCQVTGYGGTTQEAKHGPSKTLSREMTVTFNADIDPGLAWEFAPEQKQVTVKIGEQKLIYYRAHNKLNVPVKGHATYNVLPFAAGSYFVKIECFCFKEQVLAPGQSVDMPVLFFIDPSVVDDKEMDAVKTITLSYTFFPVKTEATKTP